MLITNNNNSKVVILVNQRLDDLRQQPRKRVCHRARLLALDSPPIDLEVVDLCEDGTGAVSPTPLPPGSTCMLAWDAVVDGKLRKINLWGLVVHCNACGQGFRVGIKCLDYDPMSRDYLARLSQ